MADSDFASWFEDQHGPRQNGLMFRESDQMLRDRVMAGRIAQAELDSRALWDEKRTSALYAWQVPQEDRNG